MEYRRAVFAPRDADAGLRLAVTAAGFSIPVWVTIYARHLLKSKYKEKRTTSNEVVLFGDPYGNRIVIFMLACVYFIHIIVKLTISDCF